MELGVYVKRLFENDYLIWVSVLGSLLCKLCFPEASYLYAAGAVLGIMLIDLLTKLYALSKQAGGIKKAIGTHKITSSAFAKGTLDKLLVFGIMLIICGLAYRLTPITEVATWFTQIIFTLMFLRDALSILENLNDAGVRGLGIFKKVIQSKMEEITGESENDKEEKL